MRAPQMAGQQTRKPVDALHMVVCPDGAYAHQHAIPQLVAPLLEALHLRAALLHTGCERGSDAPQGATHLRLHIAVIEAAEHACIA